MFLAMCGDERCDFRVKQKQWSIPLDSHLFNRGLVFYLVICIYVYLCPTRFPYQMMFVSLNSNTTGVTCGAGTANLSGAPEITPVFSAIRVVLCR